MTMIVETNARTDVEERLRTTAELFCDAWHEASESGVPAERVAEAAAHALFACVLSDAGEARSLSLLNEIGEALSCGQYLPRTAIQ